MSDPVQGSLREPQNGASSTNTPVPETSSVSDSSSTESIVSATLADLSEGAPDDTSADTLPDAAAYADGDHGTAIASLTPAERDELAEALGLGPKPTGDTKHWWTRKVPYSKIKAVIDAREKAAREQHEAALKTHADKVSAYEQQIQEVAAVEQMILSDPERFVQSLVQMNPAYRQYFSGSQAPEPHAQAINPDGTVNLQAFAAQIEQQVEQRIAQRYAPIEQEHRVRAIHAAALPKVQAQLEEAKSWPMFEENKGEILKVLQADPKIDLRGAYQKAVLPKLAANRDAIRQEVLAEFNRRPHSTSVTSSSGAHVDPGPADTHDIVRRQLANLR